MIGYCHDTVVCLSVRVSVCPSVLVCYAVHCGAQGRFRGLKVVLTCS